MFRLVQELFVHSGFDFTATGSRIFGNATSQSDYDYFAPNSRKLVDFLIDLGFRIHEIPDKDLNYIDNSIVAIAEYNESGAQVHVQLIKPSSLELKKKAQAFIFNELKDVHNSLPKKQRTRLWEVIIGLM